MELLEREQPIEDLKGLLRAATNGRGHIVFVSGEAGIDKTSLVEHFLRRHSGDVRKLIDGCEALFTPRPLDPFCDIASQAQGKLHALVKQDFPRALLFSSLLDELQKSTVPTILVFEDIHWADETTLDLIKFLGRRIQSLSVLLLLTFRNDELGPDHPL